MVCLYMTEKVEQMNIIAVDDANELACLDVNRYEVEQSAIFLDYSIQALKNSVDNYKSLNIYHRGSLAKNIDSIRSLYDRKGLYLQLLDLMAADHEDIQRQVLSFLIALHTRNLPLDLHSQFVTPLIRILTGNSLELKEASCIFLEKIFSEMEGADRVKVLGLAHTLQKKGDEESKIAGLQLVARLSRDMDQGKAVEVFGEFFKEPYSHGSVRLKKEIIHNLPAFAQPLPQQFLNFQVIPEFFLERCRQPIWGIRKACVEALPHMVALTKTKKDSLSTILVAFTKDGSKIVRLSAFKAIPEFLARYGSAHLPQGLFDLYCGLAWHEVNKQANQENEIVEKVAYYLPGILQVGGVEKWGQLKVVMQRLLAMKSEEVKLPIASSLHEISRIIGPALASQTIFQVVDQLLKEESEQLNLAVISHFADFVAVFDKPTRENLIDFFLVLQNDPKKWRARYEIAKQLATLSAHYSSDVNFQYLFPITLKLCSDTRSLVRDEAASHMHQVITAMSSNKQLEQAATESIICLGNSTVYQQRQILAYMLATMSKLQFFRKKIMEDMLFQLAKDPVVAVRVALAGSLARCEQKQDWRQKVEAVTAQLAQDKDECVRVQLTSYQ